MIPFQEGASSPRRTWAAVTARTHLEEVLGRGKGGHRKPEGGDPLARAAGRCSHGAPGLQGQSQVKIAAISPASPRPHDFGLEAPARSWSMFVLIKQPLNCFCRVLALNSVRYHPGWKNSPATGKADPPWALSSLCDFCLIPCPRDFWVHKCYPVPEPTRPRLWTLLTQLGIFLKDPLGPECCPDVSVPSPSWKTSVASLIPFCSGSAGAGGRGASWLGLGDP